jgi:hypothetical protein
MPFLFVEKHSNQCDDHNSVNEKPDVFYMALDHRSSPIWSHTTRVLTHAPKKAAEVLGAGFNRRME